MAAEMVIWENLEKTLDTFKSSEDILLLPMKEELLQLQHIVKRSRGTIAALENRDHINSSRGKFSETDDLSGSLRHGRAENLSTLLYQADDLLDLIQTFSDRRTMLIRERREIHNHLLHQEVVLVSRSIQEGNAVFSTELREIQSHSLQQEGNVVSRSIQEDNSVSTREQREIQSHLLQQEGNVVSRTTQEVRLFRLSAKERAFAKKMRRRVKEVSNAIETLIVQLYTDSTNEPNQSLFPKFEFKSDKNPIIGRKDEKRNIINKLLQASKDGKSNVSAICMSGVAGVGKSTLAKEIYDDEMVKSHFDLRMWISVSQVNDEKEIIQEIVESCTNRRSNYHNTQDHQKYRTSFLDLLRCRSVGISTSLTDKYDSQDEFDINGRRLRKEIRGKLYLLVLDDVYLQQWKSLIDLLAGGANGSQILVTTRSSEIEGLIKRETDEVEAYSLQGMTREHSWDLFKSLELKQDHSAESSSEAKTRETVWFKIADTCKHVPLTIKVAARFLNGKTEDEWSMFEEGLRFAREKEKDVMEHVLLLSYYELPTRLRACLGYCSLFHDDFTFNKHDLISLWIAQGFIIPQDKKSLEEVGEMYFMELSRRCLLEPVSTDELGNILTCEMHPIVSNLAAKFTAGVSSIHIKDSGMIQVLDPTCKHILLNCRGGSSLKFASFLAKDPSLRTLIFVKEPSCDIMMHMVVCNKLISSYKRLRVLDLQDLGLTELPDLIGDHIHLRYLDLSKNDGLTTLPKKFTRLFNLQTLKLNSCPKLKSLPSNFGQLVNLEHFEVDGCSSLTSMPISLEKLTKLTMLSRIVVGTRFTKQTAPFGLKGLTALTMLGGRLAIELTGDYWTQNILEAKEALCNKENLVEVKISWPKGTSDVQGSMENEVVNHGKILENLRPNEKLTSLCIEGYKGNDFPSWASKGMVSSLPNLAIISIEGCGKCQFLPPFGKLPHLKKLTLRHMANVQYIEDATLLKSPISGKATKDIPFFESLQELTLHNFYNLEGWSKEVASMKGAKTKSFPLLSKLRIWNCPKLASFPLFIEASDINLRNINHLLLEECAKKATKVRNNSSSMSLKIKGCLGLEGLGAVRKGLGGLFLLKHLTIDSCNALFSLAADVGQIRSLESLVINNCKELDLCNDSKISSLGGHVPYLNNLMHRSPWLNLKYLRELKLRELPKMKTLPEGIKYVITLKALWISVCRSLVSLPEWISSLTALQHLRIENCRSLKRLPEELKNIKFLMKVEIIECPVLMQRCREHTGEDWPNINHARVLLHKSRRYGYRQ